MRFEVALGPEDHSTKLSCVKNILAGLGISQHEGTSVPGDIANFSMRFNKKCCSDVGLLYDHFNRFLDPN